MTMFFERAQIGWRRPTTSAAEVDFLPHGEHALGSVVAV
jgi:hypothetical protein